MHRALDGLNRLAPAFVIVDGNRFRPARIYLTSA
jgi:hypothetical protein